MMIYNAGTIHMRYGSLPAAHFAILTQDIFTHVTLKKKEEKNHFLKEVLTKAKGTYFRCVS